MRKGYNVKIIIGAIIILIIAQALNFALCISSFQKVYKNSLISKYQITAKELKKEIERPINFGKPIDKLSNMDSILGKISSQDKHIKNLFITSPTGVILGSTEKNALTKMLKVEPIPYFKSNTDNMDQVILQEDLYYIASPIFYNNEELVGLVFIQFSKSVIADKIQEIVLQNLHYFLWLLLAACVLLVISIYLLDKLNKSEEANSGKKLSLQGKKFIAIIAVLIIVQTLYTYMNVSYFRNSYLNVTESNVTTVSNILKEDIEYFLSLGLHIDRLNKLENLLSDSLKSLEQCDDMVVTNTHGTVLYKVDKNARYGILDKDSLQKGQVGYNVSLEKNTYNMLAKIEKNQENQGYIVLNFNKKMIDEKISDIVMDALTIIIISLIFSLELIRFLSLVADSKKTSSSEEHQLAENDKDDRSIKLIRIAGFTFFFAELIPISFLPMFISSIYEKNPIHIFNLSKETIISLPISAYMLGVTIFIPIVGFLSKKISVKKLFLICIGLAFTGALFTALSFNFLQIVIFRFIEGLGYGGTLITAINFVIENVSEKNRTTGFGHWTAGYAAASICALPISGMVVDKMGYRAGMFIAVLMAVFFALIVFFNVKESKTVTQDTNEEEGIKLKEMFVVFKNKGIASCLFFMSIPLQITFIGIYQYFFPLYMNKTGLTEGNIGRLMTIVSVISLVTPIIGRVADRLQNTRIFFILGNSIVGITFILYHFGEGIFMLIFAMIAIGIGNMLYDAVEESYLTASEEAKRVGEAKLISIYATYEKLSCVVAPIIIGQLLSKFQPSTGIVIMGVFILMTITIFALTSKQRKQRDGSCASSLNT